jgi:hypothetical protein
MPPESISLDPGKGSIAEALDKLGFDLSRGVRQVFDKLPGQPEVTFWMNPDTKAPDKFAVLAPHPSENGGWHLYLFQSEPALETFCEEFQAIWPKDLPGVAGSHATDN